MAIRSDLTINWDASPRIITIDAPSTSITMQDLYDSMRDIEPVQIDEEYIIDGAGGEPLGGGVSVGLTLTLNNAQIAFEARPGPEYIQCYITGGNLVAVDENGDNISAVHPTSFTQIVQSNSSSATQSDLQAIQFASFQNAVWVNPNTSNTGIEYPVGNSEYPVNNIPDAVQIASNKGFDTLNIRESITLDTGDNIANLKLVGRHAIQVVITVNDGAIVNNVQISAATVLGILDGNTILTDCFLTDLHYVNGIINSCSLDVGIIHLDGNSQATFNDCISIVAGNATPTIDFEGAGQSLVMRNYAGGIALRNRSGDEPISIDLTSGQIVLESTFLGGSDIRLAGSGRIKSYTTVEYDDSGLVTGTVTIPSQGYIVVDLNSSYTGDVYPVGTIPYPVNNFSDAILLAAKHNVSTFKGKGALVLTEPGTVTSAEFIGLSSAQSSFNFGTNLTFDYLTCLRLTVSGTCTGTLDTLNCTHDGVLNYTGTARETVFQNTSINTFGAGMSTLFSPAFVGNEVAPVVLDLNAAGVILAIENGAGGVKMINLGSDDTLYIHMSSGSVELDSTVTGTVRLYGTAKLIDNTVTATVNNHMVSTETITDSIFNANMSLYNMIGTFGNWMKKILYGSK